MAGKPTPTPTPSALSDAAKAAGLTEADLAAARAALPPTTSSTRVAKTPITKTYYPQVYSPTQAKSFIIDQFKSLLNREPSAEEITKYAGLLKAKQEKLSSAASQAYKATGGTATSKTITGLDEAQWLKDEIQKDKKLAAEYQAQITQAPTLTQTLKDKAIFDKMIADAKGDLGKIQAARETTTYGQNLTEIETYINDLVMNKGAQNDPGQVAQMAKQILDKGWKLNSETAKSFIESQLKFGKGKVTAGPTTTDMYTGEAGSNVEALNRVALANGLTLDSVFDAPTLNEILSSVNKGEPVDTYAKLIRDAAKVAWNVPDNVAKLMDQGVSLDSIYGTYKRAYADTLELDPNTVTLKDLASMGVIGQPSKDSQAPQNLYDFQKSLRKDPRWQYTQQANQEVADATRQVLRDFGFMG